MEKEKTKILLVEDDKFIRDVYKDGLGVAGFEVIIAQDGETCLELATKQKFDLILLDLIIPKMNGFEILKVLKNDLQTQNIPVIVLSNLGEESDVKKVMELGATDYMIKSNISIKEIIEKIKFHLREGKSSKKTSGAISKGLLIFGAIVLLTIIIVFVLVRVLSRPVVVVTEEETKEETPSVIFEADVENIRFNLIDAVEKGKTLYGKDSIYPLWQEDLTTTERFIQVTIGAVNKGTEYIEDRSWDIGEIVDSEGRKFLPIVQQADPWLPENNQCGVLLKPEFSPRECNKIYEVAEVSHDLKVRVFLNPRGGGGLGLESGPEAFINLGF